MKGHDVAEINVACGAEDPASDSIGIVAIALSERFGDQAADVARRQVIEAADDNVRAWLLVLERLNSTQDKNGL